RQHALEGDVVANFSTPDIAADEITGSAEPDPAAEAAAAQEDQAQADADAHDEAVLEAVAAQMSASEDPIHIDDFSASVADDISVTMRAPEPVAVTPGLELISEPAPMPVRLPIVQPFPQAVSAAASLPPTPVVASLPSSPAPSVSALPSSSPVV